MRSLNQIFSYLGKYRWYVVISFFFGIVSVVMANFMPYIQKELIDRCFIDRQFDAMPLWVGLYLLVMLLRVGGYFVQRYDAELAAEYTIYDLKNKLFDHIQRLSFTYHDETEAGQLISRSTADMEAIRVFLGQGIVAIIQFFVMILSCIIFCLIISWKLSLAIFLLLPVIGVFAWKYSHKIRPLFFKVQDQIGVMTTFLNQNLLGIKVVKAFVREDDQIKQFDTQAVDLFNRYMETSKVSAFYSPFIGSLALIGQILIFLYGGYLAVKGEMTVGGIVAFIGYFGFLLGPVNAISMYVAWIQNAVASGDRVFEILRRRPERIKDGHINMGNINGKVEFKNVNFSYSDGFEALKHINLVAEPGEMIGIIGATGSGKTTLVNLISRFYDVSYGEIEIDGINIKDYTLDTLRRHVGIVAQESFLFGDTIRANISYPRNASMEEIEEAAKAANIHDFIMSLPLGYDTPIGERGVDLSGGQKQRMSIARALLLNPDILILDDSTSALDTHTEALIQAAINNVSTQRTTFMIAQRVSAIVNADKIIVLDEGKIVECGTHKELLEMNGYYKKIFESQLLAKKGGEE
ncbi:MAG: ABC transporter ATP-binding protein [Armatimonadetes bacterium]|nr:ABC transporter ATP-binding protein [Candidatus Hippobium faecium]